jgi:mycofactocin precursor
MPDTATELLDRPAEDVAEAKPADAAGEAGDAGEVIAADLLVEEISIDGMCGVY